ncbi:unnamed protein product [Periconia digitata]|uniref:Heterokaryon incompatibility domain-containing protein n=1 Tax=Periconia digitata TaxID=1303443 RepID=A0A9W4XRU8_9PLEO|nr:unnamed protein product [Periconia digitata]
MPQQNQRPRKSHGKVPPCNDPWVAENSHICRYCAAVVIDPQSSDDRGSRATKFKYGRVKHARRAAVKGCKLFHDVIDKDGRRDIDGEVYFGFSFTPWNHSKFDLSYCRVEYLPSSQSLPFKVDIAERWSIAVSPGDPAAAYISTPSPNYNINSTRAYEFAKQCLKDCESHQDCHPLTPAKGGPRRLIEVGSDDEQLKLREDFPENPKYAALSYCWGGEQNYKTNPGNIMSYQQKLNLPSTAKTILDAISVTRKIGLQYLWVDALCIIQDSPDDMVAELARMPDIYKAAYVTIVALTSDKSSTGFLEPRTPPKPMYRLPYQCPTGELGSVLLFDPYIPGINSDYTIKTRAWTFQEEILSTRTLEFGNDMLWWSCNHGIKSDGGKYHDFQTKNRKLSGDPETVMKEWKSIVRTYTARKMTNKNDRFNAIASIAAEVAQILERSTPGVSTRYAAGLWDTDLSAQLLWHTQRYSKLQNTPASYRAPSWSWGSVDDNITFWDNNGSLHEDPRWQIDLENEKLSYGQAKSGFLALVGQVKKAVWAKGREHLQDENFPNAGLGNLASTMPDFLQDHKTDSLDLKVWCLVLAQKYQFHAKYGSSSERVAGLILRPLGTTGQTSPANMDSVRTVVSSASEVDEDGVYRDKSFQEPILRHTDMTFDANPGDEVAIPACESFLFQRVGFFEMHHDMDVVRGFDEYASDSDIAEEKEKWKWFKDCPRQSVYIV